MVSIVFMGILNYKEAAHPTHVFFTLNLNCANGEQVPFANQYCINSTLYAVFAAQAEKEILDLNNGVWPEALGDFSESICREEDFLHGVEIGEEFFYYRTAEGIGISYPVPYSMGDYRIAEIPYEKLCKATTPMTG